MRKILKKSFLCAVIVFFGAYNSIATTIIGTSTSIPSIPVQNSYPLQFNGSSIELTIDGSGTITSIDLNASSAPSIVINQNNNVLLGSVYDRQSSVGGGTQTTITLGNNSTLTLTGDNYWAIDGGSAAFVPNSYYDDSSSYDFFIIDHSGNFLILNNIPTRNELEAYLFIKFYAAAIPHTDQLTYKGPYNLYSGVSSIRMGSNTNFIVDTTQSSSGNKDIFTSDGVANNSPTILTNSFVFDDAPNSTLTINTPLIVTHPSIGNFGHITAANTNNTGAAAPSLVINAGSQHTTISSIWDNNVAPLFALSDTTITDPSIAGSTIYIGTDTSTLNHDI